MCVRARRCEKRRKDWLTETNTRTTDTLPVCRFLVTPAPPPPPPPPPPPSLSLSLFKALLQSVLETRVVVLSAWWCHASSIIVTMPRGFLVKRNRRCSASYRSRHNSNGKPVPSDGDRTNIDISEVTQPKAVKENGVLNVFPFERTTPGGPPGLRRCQRGLEPTRGVRAGGGGGPSSSAARDRRAGERGGRFNSRW